MRILTAAIALLISDFETRNFVSFSYFGAFYIAIIVGAGLVDRERPMPWYAWLVPVLVVSKPSVLAVMPLLAFLAVARRGKFRTVAVLSLFAGLVQLAQMSLSRASGGWSDRNVGVDLVVQIGKAIEYTYTILGVYLSGPSFLLKDLSQVFQGLFVMSVIILVFISRTSLGTKITLVLGLNLLSMNSLLLLGTIYPDLPANLNIYRHVVVGFLGFVLVLAALIDALPIRIHLLEPFPLKAFALFVWLVLSGWLGTGLSLNQTSPHTLGWVSPWVVSASRIGQHEQGLVVPVDPVNWAYGEPARSIAP